MNQSAMRLFVRTLITEAKAEKATKLPKSSGKLMDLKKELAALEQMKEEIQTAKFAEKTAETEVEFANLSKFAKELDKIKAGGVALEANIDAKIEELKGKIETQKNKIKEMIGMTPAPGQEKMVDEKKEKKEKKADTKASKSKHEKGETKEEEKEEHMEEARFKKGTDIGKPGKGFEKIAKSAAKQYGSEEAGKKVAGAILKKVVKKESELKEGQVIAIKKDFTLDGKDFKKGQRVSTQPDFDTIEAAGKAGKIKQGEHFVMGMGSATLKEYEQYYKLVGGQCRRYNDEGEDEGVSMGYCR
jgi:hypothetical protein